MEINYTQTNDNLHIIDSYKVSKKKFRSIIVMAANDYYKQYGSDPDWYAKRNHRSLRCEWALHNLLYRLGLWRERTKDADLNYPSDKPEWLYIVLGSIAWLLIK